MNLLHTENLFVGYGQCKLHQTALNYSLSQGKLICLLGPNGIGKSTLLRTFAGFNRPLEGRVFWSENQPSLMKSFERAAHTAFVSPHPSSPEHMRAIDAIKLGRFHFTGWLDQLSAKDKLVIDKVAEQLEVNHLLDRTLQSLSDGERQRIEIARCLCQQAKLLILDEPTAFLDLPHKVRLMQSLQNLCHTEKISAILSTHDLDLSLGWADEIILFTGQRKILVGSPEEIVLSGDIMQFCEEAQDTWDISLGYLRIRSKNERCINLEGPECLQKIWTQRGLERLGYRVNNHSEGHKPIVAVQIKQESERCEWILHRNNEQQVFDNIKKLLDQLVISS